MSELRERIYEAVGALRNARARERAADVLETALEIAADEEVLVSLRAERPGIWRFTGGEVQKLDVAPKRKKTPPGLEISVDVHRLTSALPRARNIQQLVFQSGMRVSGNSQVIVAVSREINRRCFAKGEGERDG